MSALFGFHNLNECPVRPETLTIAKQIMYRRGHVYAESIVSDRVGIGFVANHPGEGSFYQHSDTSIVAIADARLDNRDTLIGLLRLGRPDVSNAEIITAGYLKWGIGCLRYLEGDFAFVIWDPQDSQMFCARDRMGLKQLLYHYDSGKIFAFSTDAKAIFALSLIHI